MTGGLDDTDMPLLRRLEATPLVPPVTAIFAYVPIYLWPKLSLPEPHLRIMLTTYDSGVNTALPQPRLVFICNQMDQVWVVNAAEEQAWIRAGLEPRRVRSFKSPHLWLGSKLLPPPKAKETRGEPFRFLYVALYLPRRRMDVLLHAFFEEFRKPAEAELYLKMTYPSWHPKGPGKAKKDLAALIQYWRRQTGSQARVIVDEELGTRLGMVRLMDSSDVYVSPDLVSTAPAGEAIIRKRPVIVGEGWGIDLPPQAWVVPNTSEQIQVTPEMAEYMPHLRGTSFPSLDLGLMRQALRRFYRLSNAERQEEAEAAYSWLYERYSFEATTPSAIAAIQQGWKDKAAKAIELKTTPPREPEPKLASTKAYNLHWCGLQLFHGRFSTVSREICLELLRRGHKLSLVPGNGPFHVEELDLNQSPKFPELAARFYDPLPGPADFNVCSRLLPSFNERPATRQILFNTWWASGLPVHWVKPISEHVQEVWVPSRFVRDNVVRAGVPAHRVQIIPFGVDPAVFRQQAPPARLKTRKGFKFLFVGEASARKGFDLLLQAYLGTFRAHDDVCLVVKDMNCEDYYARRAGQELVRKCQASAGCPEIEYLDSMVGEEELAGLYTACDCFVQPFRSAGFGLAILEAMACGLPVITTGYGGPLDFCDDQTAWLLPARDSHRYSYFAGPWRIDSDLLNGKIQLRDLQDRMNHLYRNPKAGVKRADLARERVHAKFTWARTVDRIVERFEVLEQSPLPSRARRQLQPSTVPPEAASTSKPQPDGPTLLVFAPFYNRSGYGVAARSLVTALHAAGRRIRVVSVDEAEPGIDDCDLDLLKSLERTPATVPLAALFFHVPSSNWLKVQLPPQSMRIMLTTFDSSAQGNLPPKDWISVCNKMDQVWLMTAKEASAFAAAGVPESKIKVIRCPHHWVNNPFLPPPQFGPKPADKPFRLLSIAMFQPRRRWDTLIEAYLLEFKDEANVELYLKVNYPSWHPEPGRPKKDLCRLIEKLRAMTGSQAPIIVDESLDTRVGICRLLDSCQAYVSTDTCGTAPIGEAFARGRIAVLPEDFGLELPYSDSPLLISVEPGLSRPITEAELAYQPHHRGKQMPLLRVEDVRRSLRAAFELPDARRREMGQAACRMAEASYAPAIAVSEIQEALDKGLLEKFPSAVIPASRPVSKRTVGPSPARRAGLQVSWEGTFLDSGSLSYVNRELTKALERQSGVTLARVDRQTQGSKEASCPELSALAQTLRRSPPAQTHITVRHAWPPDWRRPASGSLLVIQPWEFGSLPVDWVANSRQVDEFWVPSTYVREVYVKSGMPPEKVKVVPNGIDPEKFRPEAKPMPLATAKSFKFLFVGGTIHRKGADVLLDTYLRAFTAQDDVCLVIKDFGGKSVYTGQTMEARIKAAQAQPNAPEILYLNTELTPEALPGLYTACNCLAHPYRGEGFGLPMLEAMACGLPVIVTAGGAADDFAGEDFAYRIPATRRVFGDSVSGMKLAGPGWLLEPDSRALADRMKWVVEHRDEARAKGLRASDYVRREWTWERAAQIAAEHLQRLVAPAAALNAQHSTPNPQRPAPVPPPCALLGQLAPARQLLGCKEPREAWKATLAAIKARPYHPEAYLLLAEIAGFVGDGHSARLCAEQAHHLAPDWKPARQFLNHPLKGNTRPDWLTLPERLQESGADITHHRPSLSVCVIAKNEEKFLGQCLKSVKDLAQQIIVVDTGSTDRTVEIAKEYGAEVHQFNWCDDFSAARNAALEHARGDWILVLDADEELPGDQQIRLQTDLANRKLIACRLPLVNRGQEAEGRSYVPRLFRNAPGVCFHGRIHEQVFPSLIPLSKAWGLPTGLGTTQLLHHGYTAELTRDRGKVERNLRLLRLAAAETPDDANLMMNLGLELVRSGDLGGGLEHYRQAFQLMCVQPPGDIVPELREALLTQFTCQLYKIRAHEEVVSVLTSPLARKGGLTASMHFALGLSHFELKGYAESAEQMRQCLAKRQQPALAPINTDILTAAPYHCLAMCLTRVGDTAGAEKAYEAGLAQKGRTEDLKLDYVKFLLDQNRPVDALHRLHEIVANNTLNAAAWQLGGKVALSRPDFLEFARDWTTEACRCLPQDALVAEQRAEALLFNGDTAGARQLWKCAWDNGHAPEALAALVLCDILSGTAPQAPGNEIEGLEASRAFVALYQKCLAARAQRIVSGVNGKINELRCVLPTAAMMIETALAEADHPAVACPA
jgi:glycosyltransferase involved in cell wall biosynthesis/Flp pilus assembly protein TadD